MKERKHEDYTKYYEIISLIGNGYYSEVYKGKEKITNEFRAIKIMDLYKMKIFNEFEKNINRYKNEYENTKNNINSVKCYEYFIDDYNFVVVMELCDGSLSQLIKKKIFLMKKKYMKY